MDETTFAHLRPKKRAEEYAAQVAKYIDRCPVDEANSYWRNSAYWQIIRSCKFIDCYRESIHHLSYRTSIDHYRVRTKSRRAEVRNIVFLLPFVDIYENDELDSERQQLIESGQELVNIYDAIIKACSPSDSAGG